MPWLGSSVWGVQRVRSVSEAPADLRLKMNVPSQCGAEAKARRPRRLLPPLRPLDMVDLRTPSSMTLTWNAGDLRGQASEPLTQLRDLVTFKVPTVDGGNPVTSYQLYRDAPGPGSREIFACGPLMEAPALFCVLLSGRRLLGHLHLGLCPESRRKGES